MLPGAMKVCWQQAHNESQMQMEVQLHLASREHVLLAMAVAAGYIGIPGS